MRNLLLALNAVLIIAVGLLYYLHFSAGNYSNAKQTESPSFGTTKIVYINTDSLLFNYKLSRDLNESLLKKQEDARASLNFKVKKFEEEAADFQRKLQNNGFLSRERAEKAQQDLVYKQQDLQQLERKMASELVDEQSQMSARLHDTLTNFLREYNSNHNFELIISTTRGGNVLFSKDGLDITKEVVDKLNARLDKK